MARRPDGFALLEMLIVVAVLGILAGVTVPFVRRPVADADAVALAANLQRVRGALESFRAQHPDVEAVYPGQLVIATDRDGGPGGAYGPYLRHGYPVNPLNGLDTVRTVDAMPEAPDGDTGWLYAPDGGEFRANVAGSAANGQPYFAF